MPDQRDDDHLVPPMKVMRKRLNGVYRADTGFSGPTRRYVLIVAMLVGLASVPTLAAITAGSRELSGGRTDTMDIPFLPPPSEGPVRQQPSQDPSSSQPDSVSAAAQGALKGANAAVRAGKLLGQAGSRKPVTPGGSGSSSDNAAGKGSDSSGAHNGRKHSGPSEPRSRHDSPGGSRPSGGGGRDNSAGGGQPSAGGGRDDRPGGGGPSGGWAPGGVRDGGGSPRDGAGRDDPAHWGRKPFVPGLPPVPETDDQDEVEVEAPTVPGLPDVPDDPEVPDNPDVPDDADVPDDPDDSEFPADHDREPADRPRHRGCEESKHSKKTHRSVTRHRSRDRSEHSRRSAVAERSNNIRPSSILERSYANTGAAHRDRLILQDRSDENQNRSYRGSHRASSQHHADDQTAEQQRSSRVGRHHAEHSEDLTGRW